MSEMLHYPIDPTNITEGRRETAAPTDEIEKDAQAPTEIIISAERTEAKVAPEKGGMVTSLAVGGEEILFIDQEAFADPNNVKLRAGIPVLLPYAGNITKEVGLQHGGAREVPWVWQDSTDDSTSVSLDSRALPGEMRVKLKQIYGDDFEYRTGLRVTVGEGSLKYELAIKNNSHQSMPFAPGFHPYFAVENSRRAEVTSNIPGFDISKMDQSHSLILDRPQGDVWFTTPAGKKITYNLSPEFKHIVVWGVDGADHLCIEPFVANPQEYKEYVGIAAGEEANFSVEIKVEDQKDELPQTSESARTNITDFMGKAAKVEEMFDFDEWMLNKDNGDYCKQAGRSLGDAFSAYLVMLSATDRLIIAGDNELREAGFGLQQAITQDKDMGSLAGKMQTYIVSLTVAEGEGIRFDRERLEEVQEFIEKTTLLAADLQEKIAEYERKKLGYGEVRKKDDNAKEDEV